MTTTLVVSSSTSSSGACAYAQDIPGSRVSPDDPWPRSYTILQEESIWRELRLLAKPQSTHFNAERGWRADSVNFQPSPTTKTQDRYVVKTLEISGESWTFTGVFDGHLGDVTVDHVAKHLPLIVQEFLQNAFDNERSRLDDPAFISDCFSRSIVAFDKAIASDVLDLFGGVENLSQYTDAQISQIINDQHKGGNNYRKARLNMYGTTALVALVDPNHENLWIANLGDCQAVLVSHNGTSGWNIQPLTQAHNGDNDAEVARIRSEHANEPEAVIDRRILGALHPTRSLGDSPFKQPPAFTRRILYNLSPGFQDTSPWEEFLLRNRTPPYISAQPDVSHVALSDIDDGATISGGGSSPTSSSSVPSRSLPRFLIMSSDGFTDLCAEGQHKIINDWVHDITSVRSPGDEDIDRSNINNILPMSPSLSSRSQSPFDFSPTRFSTPGNESRNMALRLLRHALGGEDRASVSRVLTLDMPEYAWIDDTSIVVQTL
ncbi:hypothetical protein D9757_002923 [Collybiopsis confluens]|uniref:PPM-type phosphatase domain-containing protein n=1 Tax=Collybiopsis confluens TaxID=2823264 RepID=A0A8H5MDN2_9AGAR|nr:hypothetical protein D9757_002923 [Collybiopsis confluens]